MPNHPSHSGAGLVTISRTPFNTANNMAPVKAAFVRRAQAFSPRFSASESGPEFTMETVRCKETCLAPSSITTPTITPNASTITTVLSRCASTVVTVCPGEV